MKRMLLLGSMAMLAFTGVLAEETDRGKAFHLARYASWLQSMNMSRFWGIAISNDLEVLPIRSHWYKGNAHLDSYVEDEIVSVREFGSALFLRIEDWGAEAKAAQPSAESIRQFLDLADWVMKRPGYGNYFIARRCHEIAAEGLARALLDTNCPLNQLTNLFSRFDVGWYRPTVRARILDEDFCGNGLMVELSHDEARQQEILERTWRVGRALASRLDVVAAVGVLAAWPDTVPTNAPLTVFVMEDRPRTAQEVINIWLGQVPEENYSADALMKIAFGGRLPANAHEIRPLLSRWLER